MIVWETSVTRCKCLKIWAQVWVSHELADYLLSKWYVSCDIHCREINIVIIAWSRKVTFLLWFVSLFVCRMAQKSRTNF